MTTTTKHGESLSPAEFDAIREAVMETPRGRWFLTEYANRLRVRETATMLDSMKRLEGAIVSNHEALMRRLAEAIANDSPRPPSATPQPGLAPGQMKYFKQDEDIFEPAPQPQIAAVAPLPKAEVPKGAKLVIHRTSEAAAIVEAAPVTEVSEPSPAPAQDAAPPEPPAAEALPTQPAKRRIVIIRHKPGEEIDVPMQNDMAEAS